MVREKKVKTLERTTFRSVLPALEAGTTPLASPPPDSHCLPASCCAAWPPAPPVSDLRCPHRSPDTHTHTPKNIKLTIIKVIF